MHEGKYGEAMRDKSQVENAILDGGIKNRASED